MAAASEELGIVEVELIKNTCRKILYMDYSCIHPFGVGNGKFSLKVSIFSHN